MAAGKTPVLIAIAALIALVSAWRCFVPPLQVPEADSLAYANLAMNLVEHGTLSDQRYDPATPPRAEPVSAGPLIIGEVSLVVLLDGQARRSFSCALLDPAPLENCRIAAPGLRIAHFIEIMAFFALLFLLARAVLADETMAAAACLIALGFGEVFAFARVPLTEPLFLTMVTGFLLAWVKALDNAGQCWRWGVAGAMLALTMLVKTAFLALLILTPLILLPFFIGRRGGMKGLAAALLCLAGGYVAIAAPFHIAALLRDGALSLTSPIYLRDSLAHRFGYNGMTLPEWFMAWIYYLPDFGDNLARALFGADAVARLGWGDGSLYAYGRDVLQRQSAEWTDPARATEHLLDAIVSDPVSYFGVSLVLMWRGLFVGKYLGIAGLASLPAALWLATSCVRERLLAAALPVFVMAGIHGALSVSLTRYNLALIPIYACSLAWVVITVLSRRTRSTASAAA